jgi:hypothetical protein
MTETYSFFVFSDEQLASTVVGASGAKKIGISAITGMSASDVQAALEQLADLSGTTPASETAAGIAEIATQAETDAGTDNARIVTPAKLAGRTATETRSGIVELATSTETQAGMDNVRAIHAAGLKSELDRRQAQTSQIGSFLAGDGPTVWSAVPIAANSKTVSTDLRGVGGVPSDAKGVFLAFRAGIVGTNRLIYLDSADAPLATTQSPMHWVMGHTTSGHFTIPLGTGANAGKIALLNNTTGTFDVWAHVTGWWR